MFGRGIYEPVLKIQPLLHQVKIWLEPKTARRQKGREGGWGRDAKSRHFSQAKSQKLRNKYLDIMCLPLVFSPPISHLATCAHLINVLLITSCKSLIRMHCRYRPISEPARSHGHHLPASAQPPTGCSRGRPARFPSGRQSSESAWLNSSFK